MLRWAMGFLVLALIAALLGFGGLASTSAGIAKTLFIVFLIHRFRGSEGGDVTLAPGGKIGAMILGLSGLGVTIFAMIVATIPPKGTGDPWLFRLKVIGGALGFVLIGVVIYVSAGLRKRSA